MKLIFFILVLVAAIYGCREAKPAELREFIPGTYIRYSVQEYGEEYDTLSIRFVSMTSFEITRRWRYERLGLEPHYEISMTVGIWRDADTVIEDLETGDFLSFNIKANCLFIGTTKYDKL